MSSLLFWIDSDIIASVIRQESAFRVLYPERVRKV